MKHGQLTFVSLFATSCFAVGYTLDLPAIEKESQYPFAGLQADPAYAEIYNMRPVIDPIEPETHEESSITHRLPSDHHWPNTHFHLVPSGTHYVNTDNHYIGTYDHDGTSVWHNDHSLVHDIPTSRVTSQ